MWSRLDSPRRRRGFSIAILLLAALGADADEQLTLPTPENWQTVTQVSTPVLRMSAFAVPNPAGDGFDKLTFEWFAHTLAAESDPFSLIEQVAGAIEGNCEQGSDQPVHAGEENGYPTVVRLLLCPRLNRTDPPRGELLLLKAIKGNSGPWIVVRGREFDSDSPPTPDVLRGTVARWSESMRAITLCDPDAAEHPCPGLEISE